MNYLIKNAVAIASSESPYARDLRIRDGRIAEMGRDLSPTPEDLETIVDASGCVV